jgi:hypothetical protein
MASQLTSDLPGVRARPDGLGSVERSIEGCPLGQAHDGVPMLDRRDEIVGISRAPPVVLRALVNAIGDSNNRPLWRSEVDGMDIQGDPFLRHEAPNDPRGRP